MVNRIEIKSLAEYINEVEKLYSEWDLSGGEIWYRGVPSNRFDLIPNIVWRKLGQKEDGLTYDFLINYRPFTDTSIDNPWELYALMQHYGLPTRLLDWTKSPLIALFFALENYKSHKKDYSIVWAMNPWELNKLTVNDESIFVPGMKGDPSAINVDSYLPVPLRQDNIAGLLPDPIAIEPPFSNKRILAQQGCFTVHGSKKESILKYFEGVDLKGLITFYIEKNQTKKDMITSLYRIGISEENIYQDLSSLSKRLIREY
jgi:hypothetical protein